MLTLHFLLPFKTPVKAQDARSRSVRSELFRRFRACREGPGRARRCARRLPVQRRQAAGNDQGDGAAAGGDSAGPANSGQTATGRQFSNKICGEMSLTKLAGERTAIALMLFAAAASLLLAAGALDAALAQASPFGAPRAQRRHRRRPTASSAGCSPSRPSSTAHMSGMHPRRQDRRQRGVDAARHLVPLRHFPRRRARPRQGGDLVLSRRQRGNLAARRRAVVRLGAAAGVRRGGDRRHRGGACSTPPPDRCATPSASSRW